MTQPCRAYVYGTFLSLVIVTIFALFVTSCICVIISNDDNSSEHICYGPVDVYSSILIIICCIITGTIFLGIIYCFMSRRLVDSREKVPLFSDQANYSFSREV